MSGQTKRQMLEEREIALHEYMVRFSVDTEEQTVHRCFLLQIGAHHLDKGILHLFTVGAALRFSIWNKSLCVRDGDGDSGPKSHQF